MESLAPKHSNNGSRDRQEARGHLGRERRPPALLENGLAKNCVVEKTQRKHAAESRNRNGNQHRSPPRSKRDGTDGRGYNSHHRPYLAGRNDLVSYLCEQVHAESPDTGDRTQ